MVILLNGAIASGKTTIGNALHKTLLAQNKLAVLYDLDEEMQQINPDLQWDDEAQRLKDWLALRENVAKKTNNDLQEKRVVIISGPFFTKEEIHGLTEHLIPDIEVFLFTLHVPIEKRLEREKIRQRNTSSVLLDQEQLLTALLEKFGSVVSNDNEPEITVMTILKLIKNKEGMVDRKSMR